MSALPGELNGPNPFAASEQELRSRRVERLLRMALRLMALLLVLPVLGILSVLVVRGAPGLSWQFLFDYPRNGMREGGILPALVGTLWLTLTALVISLPLGVAAAIYLSEYARESWLTRLINVAIVNLAGVPSIVHALFGLGAFVHFMRFGASILAASCTLAVMTLPVVIVATRESLQAVPRAFREASWSLGATRWQTIRRVVLPNSGSGILTGIILEVSRTVGETAPIMFTGAAFYVPFLPQGVFDQTMALSLHLFNVSTQVTNVPEHLPFSVALVLILVVLSLNAASIWFRMRLRRRKKW
jgi:phosphate transport system permease protein